MKGMLSKAFSLALLISVVPSFAMEVKRAAEGISAEAELVVNAAEQIAHATSPEMTAQNAVISGIVVPTAWEKAKALGSQAYDYASNSRVAGYAGMVPGVAHSALVAPFNYTVGALSNRFGLTDRISSIGCVKNDTYYGTTLAKYAFGLASVYAGYRAVKAAYNYFTTPATKKAEAVKPVVVVAAPAPQAVVVKAAFVSPEHEAVVKALEAVVDKVLANNGTVANSKEALELRNFPYMSLLAPKLGKSNRAIVLEHLVEIDFERSKKTQDSKAIAERVSNLVDCVDAINKIAATHFGTAVKIDSARTEKIKASLDRLAPKAEVAKTPGYATRAYNMLVNRYTMGAAALAGTGYAVYKHGIPFYNRTK